MGTDIHAHVEIKHDGRWIHWRTCDVHRNYALFNILAGVRGREEDAGFDAPLCEPRGLPADATDAARLDYEFNGDDAHSAGWLFAAEMVEVERRLKACPSMRDGRGDWRIEDYFGTVAGTYFEHIRPGDEENQMGVEDARVVFWFTC